MNGEERTNLRHFVVEEVAVSALIGMLRVRVVVEVKEVAGPE